MVDFTPPSCINNDHIRPEKTWKLPRYLGTGGFTKIELANGLWIGLAQAQLNNPLKEEIYTKDPGVTLMFCLNGSMNNKNSCFPQGFELSERYGVMYFSPDPAITRKSRSNILLQKMLITIPLDQVELLENNQMEKALELNEPFFAGQPLCPGMQSVLYQLFHCPFQGSGRRLYLEGKAYELLANWVSCGVKERQAVRSLKPHEYERIRHAKDLLLQDLCNPPSLMELASTVGLTHTRLNYGFKTTFGCTAFEWLRKERLEKARMLIMNGGKNITEIAYEVGFASSSHFTCAFRKYYGITPSHYR